MNVGFWGFWGLGCRVSGAAGLLKGLPKNEDLL